MSVTIHMSLDGEISITGDTPQEAVETLVLLQQAITVEETDDKSSRH